MKATEQYFRVVLFICCTAWPRLTFQTVYKFPSFVFHLSRTFSSPDPTILLACGRGLWLVPNQEVRESRTSGSSTQTQKSETTVVANGYKNAPSLRLRIFRNWPELSIPAAGKKDRGLWGRECFQEVKVLRQYFPVVLFIMLLSLVLTFESVDEFRDYINLPERHWVVFSLDVVCYEVDRVVLVMDTVISMVIQMKTIESYFPLVLTL